MIFLVLGALVVGLSLGLLGSGGSILTVPVLVYLLDHTDKIAIAESLAIVGGIAFVGAVPYALDRVIDWRSVGLFGVPSMLGAYVGAHLSKYVSGGVQLAVFAGVILIAAYMMARGRARDELAPHVQRRSVTVMLDGLVVGILTGFVGVGGGFVIVPALVLLGGLDMRRAIGTSLAIISLKSAVGFYTYLGVLGELGLRVDGFTIGWFTAIGMVGTWVGKRIGSRLNQTQLRRGFAAVLVLMGLLILLRELPPLLNS